MCRRFNNRWIRFLTCRLNTNLNNNNSSLNKISDRWVKLPNHKFHNKFYNLKFLKFNKILKYSNNHKYLKFIIRCLRVIVNYNMLMEINPKCLVRLIMIVIRCKINRKIYNKMDLRFIIRISMRIKGLQILIGKYSRRFRILKWLWKSLVKILLHNF